MQVQEKFQGNDKMKKRGISSSANLKYVIFHSPETPYKP